MSIHDHNKKPKLKASKTKNGKGFHVDANLPSTESKIQNSRQNLMRDSYDYSILHWRLHTVIVAIVV